MAIDKQITGAVAIETENTVLQYKKIKHNPEAITPVATLLLISTQLVLSKS